MKVLNDLDLTGQRIINLADPSSLTDAVTKQYVDNAIAGLSWKDSVVAASTTNGALATAYEDGDTLDGVTLATGDRILLKNQTDQTENGIYVVQATGAPVRADDVNTGDEITAAAVYVESGTTNAVSAWVCNTSRPITLGTTSITFARYSADQPYYAGNGLALNGSTFTFSVLPNGASIDVSSSGIKLASAAGGAGVTVDSSGVIAVGAGTGIVVNADDVAVDTSVVVRKVSASVGNGTATSIGVTHNLGTKDIMVTVRSNSTDEAVLVDWVATSTNVVTLTFAVAPTTNAYRVTVHG